MHRDNDMVQQVEHSDSKRPTCGVICGVMVQFLMFSGMPSDADACRESVLMRAVALAVMYSFRFRAQDCNSSNR